MSEIQILVNGHEATVTHIQPQYSIDGKKEFIVVVDFGSDTPYNSTISMGVSIPARHYTREEFIKVVTKAAIEEVDKDQQERKKSQREDEERAKFEDFTEEVRKEVGLRE